MSDREKLIELFESAGEMLTVDEAVANELSGCENGWIKDKIGFIVDYFISNGVCLEKKQSTSEKTSNESKRIEELEAELAKQEETVVQLRKQWQEAEMLICTMCGHFDHKTDGNIVCGNRTCGEICGYPYCKAKFTMWIPVSERLPDNSEYDWVLAQVVENNGYMHIPKVMEYRQNRDDWFEETYGWLSEHKGAFIVTHWMPLPEPPKECE